MSSSVPPCDDPVDAGGSEAVTAALNAAFARLAPQGSDTWNFLANFVQMGDRYGPPSSGASDLAEQIDATPAPPGRRGAAGRRRKVAPEGPPSETHEAMAQVVEAFRVFSARVRTLEERLAREDRPVEGAAWLVPARELEGWGPPVVEYLVGRAPLGEVLHGDCGEGQLLDTLTRSGLPARGVEPHGAVALRALEQGHAVSITEVIDDLAGRSPASLGALVLSGVVDRLPLHSTLLLLGEARRVLVPGAPIVVVATEPDRARIERDIVADEILAPTPLHARTWGILLERARFAGVAQLGKGPADDGRIAMTATVPD